LYHRGTGFGYPEHMASGGDRANGERRVEAHVAGRVQGVWFRAFTQTTAIGLGVNGYVENLPDGRVHLVAAGPDERVAALLEAVRQGPPGASVEGFEVRDYTGPDVFSDFTVRP
jgi:acylphosphatase